MDTGIDKYSMESPPESNPVEYTSKVLQLLAVTFKKHRDFLVLDVGPVCNENIDFFARRAKRVYICDLFARLAQDRRKGLKPDSVRRYLDYAPDSFDVINLWDLVDHLDDDEAKRLTEICCNMLRPNGQLFVTAFEKQAASREVNAFIIKKNFRLSLRPQPRLDLSWRYRHNRALISLLRPLFVAKSFCYRSGIREFLFQRE